MEKFLIQKTQKITSALYLITELIKDTDAIKWEIREEGISLVSSALIFNTTYPLEKEHAVKLFLQSGEKLLTFLNICMISSIISEMNARIVIRELESVISQLKNDTRDTHPAGYILSDAFFAGDSIEKDSKGQKDISKTSDVETTNTDYKTIKKVTTSRKDSIIDLLRKESNLTIKDFAKVIKDCSEKTIQRELINLVKDGVVKRHGERRWSTYSLV